MNKETGTAPSIPALANIWKSKMDGKAGDGQADADEVEALERDVVSRTLACGKGYSTVPLV